jgi:hypothetical protein
MFEKKQTGCRAVVSWLTVSWLTFSYNSFWRRIRAAMRSFVVFDRYDVTDSLKTFTRQRRQGGQVPVAYHVTDSTNIAKVQMKRLLSHTKTSPS